jgi:hypothetical protein
MSKISCPAATLSAGVVLLLVFAVVLPTPAEAAKPGGGCNEGVLIPATAAFRDGANDGIGSDRGLPYVHCQDGQVSIGRSEGRFRIDTKKYNPNLAKIVVQLDAADCLSGPCSGVPLDLTTDVIFQTHTRYDCPDAPDVSTCEALPGTILDLRTMIAGQVSYTRLTVSFYQANKTSTLAFLNATEGVVSGMAACVGGNPVRVECLSVDAGSCTRWIMEGDKACYNKYLKGGGATFQGLFSVPVLFDVELLP